MLGRIGFCIALLQLLGIEMRISPVAIFPCAGNRDALSEKMLAAALEKGGAQKVRRLPQWNLRLTEREHCAAYKVSLIDAELATVHPVENRTPPPRPSTSW